MRLVKGKQRSAIIPLTQLYTSVVSSMMIAYHVLGREVPYEGFGEDLFVQAKWPGIRKSSFVAASPKPPSGAG